MADCVNFGRLYTADVRNQDVSHEIEAKTLGKSETDIAIKGDKLNSPMRTKQTSLNKPLSMY